MTKEHDTSRLIEIGKLLRERRGADYDDVRFSDAEYERRYRRVRQQMAMRGLDCLVVYGNSAHGDSNQAGIRYLSGYIDQISAYIVFPYEGEPTLFVDLYPHVPDAHMMSYVDDVRWSTYDPAQAVADRVAEMGYADGTVGLAGTVGRGTELPPTNAYLTLQKELPRVDIEFSTDILDQVCLEKSDEEIEALREGARLSDMALEALIDMVEPGVTEREMKKTVMTPFLDQGEYMFQLLGSTSMHDPDMPYPWEHQSGREVQTGDVVVTEISAKNLQGYSGQVLRSIAVGEEPTDQYRELHDVAEQVFWDVFDVLEPGATTEDVLDAATPPIEDNDLTIHAPIIHGWGLGIQHPYIGTRNEGGFPNPPFEFEAGQTVVIEPNPVTRDQMKGMFLGEIVHITADGAERLHEYPVEFIQV